MEIKLRAVEPRDLDLIYNWENQTDVWAVSGTVAPFSRYEIQRFLDSGNDIYQNRQLRLIAQYENRDFAMADLFDFEPLHLRAGVGIFIEKASRKKGLSKPLMDALHTYCCDILLLHQVYTEVGANNLPSIKMCLAAGYVQTGLKPQWLRTRDGWEDLIIMQKFF